MNKNLAVIAKKFAAAAMLVALGSGCLNSGHSNSGIIGSIVIGPICESPLDRPPEALPAAALKSQCIEQWYIGVVYIKSADQKSKAVEVNTDQKGNFKAFLEPGQYIIYSPENSRVKISSKPITVIKNAFTQVTIYTDQNR